MARTYLGYTQVAANANLDALARASSGAINVTKSPYFAVGNGTTNDTAAIQAAVDAAANGEVIFPPGFTFLATSEITVTSPCTLRFEGCTFETTAENGFVVTANNVTFVGKDADIYHNIPQGTTGFTIHAPGVDTNNRLYDLTVTGLWFHSNGGSGNPALTEHSAISTRWAQRVWIQNNRFTKYDGEMLFYRDEFNGSMVTQHWDVWTIDNHFEDGAFEGVDHWSVEGAVVVGNVIRNMRQGIEFAGRSSVIAENICDELTDDTLNGILIGNANDYRVRDVVVSDNICRNGAGYGIQLTRGMSGVTLRGNILTANGKDGILVKNLDLFAVHIPEEIIISGNVLKGNTSRGIYLADSGAVTFLGPNDVLIEGNLFVEDTVQTVGIRVDASCANIRVGINHYVDVDTPHSFASTAGVQVFDPGVKSDVQLELNVRGADTDNRDVSWWSGLTRRWTWRVSGAESSGDAGSGMTLLSRTDAGALIDAVVTLVRAAGGYIAWAAGRPMSWGGNPAGATTVTRIVRATTAIANNTATAVLTVSIPNGAHSATVRVTITGSLGAGGAIGANEASASITYDFTIARTAGVNAVVATSAGYGSSGSAAVAGADTCTVTAAASAISGAVGATNSFTVNATIARGGGASTNHTARVLAEVLNANSSGVSIS